MNKTTFNTNTLRGGLLALAGVLSAAVGNPAGAQVAAVAAEDEFIKMPRFRCVDRPFEAMAAPPPFTPLAEHIEDAEIAQRRPVCPDGQIPQPTRRFGFKGRPKLDRPGTEEFSTEATSYLYAGVYQYVDSRGMSATLTQHRPFLASNDFHTLVEIAAQSRDGRQIVEVGWTVDRGLNGDSKARLFVFHWIDGQPTCYNGCGWEQYSSTVYPGVALKTSTQGVPATYTIYEYLGNWWIGYGGQWMGYFPGSRWDGRYTQSNLLRWFGEVAAADSTPCTDMGNGNFGSVSGSASGNPLYYVDTNGAYINANVNVDPATDSSIYDVGSVSSNRFNYGGPGDC